MRGLNDFNRQINLSIKNLDLVSVPMRGLNDFNNIIGMENKLKLKSFRPHAGFK